MAVMNSPTLDEFEKALESWTDERFVSRDAIRALAKFSSHLVNISDHGGWSYYGHSYKAGTTLGCLVIKATIDDTPVVCFTSARSFCTCVKIFLRKCEEDLVEWQGDKYRS